MAKASKKSQIKNQTKNQTKSKKPIKKTVTNKVSAKKAAPKKAIAAKKAAAPKKASKAGASKKAHVVSNVVSMSQARERKHSKASASAAKPVAKATAKLETKSSAKGEKSFSNVFTPLDDRILVSRAAVSDRTPGGIIIPDSVAASEKPNQGRVLAVGNGHRNKKGRLRPLDVKMGDMVMFAKFSGSEVNIGGEDLLLLREEEIIAVVK
jgi:chaperonin GroES